MALVLAMKEGMQVRVGNETYRLHEIRRDKAVTVLELGTNTFFRIQEDQWCRVGPFKTNVFLRVSNKPHPTQGWARLMIAAPKEIGIGALDKTNHNAKETQNG